MCSVGWNVHVNQSVSRWNQIFIIEMETKHTHSVKYVAHSLRTRNLPSNMICQHDVINICCLIVKSSNLTFTLNEGWGSNADTKCDCVHEPRSTIKRTPYIGVISMVAVRLYIVTLSYGYLSLKGSLEATPMKTYIY